MCSGILSSWCKKVCIVVFMIIYLIVSPLFKKVKYNNNTEYNNVIINILEEEQERKRYFPLAVEQFIKGNIL